MSVCVSYNLDDAKEKVALVKELHDELPLEFQKKMVIDSKTVVGFESNSSRRRVSRVVSHPAKPPRGKSGDVYLDELGHCQNDRLIYAGATALISRSGGQLTVGSTPLGKRGTFHAIHTDPVEYAGYWRQRVPWWLCKHFSKIVDDPNLCALAETLPTELRVERYGTGELQDQFNALPIEDFRQEFECAWQDERVSFFAYDLILPCCQKDASKIPIYDNLDQLVQVAPKLGRLFAGFDVGRSKHPSELTIFEKQGETYTLRYQEQYRETPFPKQRARLIRVVEALGENLRRFRIDSTGMGKNLAEDLQERFGRKIVQIDFTRQSKEAMANNVKILLQERNLVLPRDRSLIAQIHSIKQKITSAGNAIFDAVRNRFHHADKFWALALAVFKKRKKHAALIEVRARVVGEKTQEDPIPDAPAPPKGIVEAVFVLPGQSVRGSTECPAGEAIIKEASRLAQVRAAPLDALEQKGRALVTAMRVWERSGDHERALVLSAEYQRVRREIRRRQALAG